MAKASERAALCTLDRRIIAVGCEVVRLRVLADALAQIGMAAAAAQVRRRITGLRDAADAAEAVRRSVLGAGPVGHEARTRAPAGSARLRARAFRANSGMASPG